MSVFVLDASYTLTWWFSDRATINTDASLKRLEAGEDSVVVPWIWQLEVTNAIAKAVTRAKVHLSRALDIWAELLLFAIRQVPVGHAEQLLQLAVKHNLSVYDACYLQTALALRLPLATNDRKPAGAARQSGLLTITP